MMTFVLILVTLCTLCLVPSTSGVKCYSCSGRGEGIEDKGKGHCRNSDNVETYEDWKEIDCSHTGFNTCLISVHQGFNYVNITHGCGTDLADPIQECFPEYDQWRGEWVKKTCNCEGDLCNWKRRGVKCHVCGGPSQRPCPRESYQWTPSKECGVIGAKGYRGGNGVCQSIRSPSNVITLACVPEITPDLLKGVGKCRQEKGNKVCYCRKDGCNAEINKKPMISGSGKFTALHSYFQLILLPFVIYVILEAATTSIGF